MALSPSATVATSATTGLPSSAVWAWMCACSSPSSGHAWYVQSTATILEERAVEGGSGHAWHETTRPPASYAIAGYLV